MAMSMACVATSSAASVAAAVEVARAEVAAFAVERMVEEAVSARTEAVRSGVNSQPMRPAAAAALSDDGDEDDGWSLFCLAVRIGLSEGTYVLCDGFGDGAKAVTVIPSMGEVIDIAQSTAILDIRTILACLDVDVDGDEVMQ